MYLLIATIANGVLGITMIVLGAKKMCQALILDPFVCDPAHVVRAFISLGIILVGMSIVGIVGLITYSEPWIQIYACLMLALAVIQIITGGIIFHRMKGIRTALNNGLEEKFQAYAQHKSEIDKLQSTFLCCGLSDGEKWNNTDLPSSCCGRETGICSPSSAFNSSCSDKVGNVVEEGFYFRSLRTLYESHHAVEEDVTRKPKTINQHLERSFFHSRKS
ncbi:tetraspanin-6-like [Cimex lectularius]|uniref:Tetraspanin n=1 Tax=Cimex lectularius TaxID=79782 RepID=A0A8I6R8V0_CIMLE|nr:tetraspanin-6-like [Cimex lectularius]